MGQPIVVKEKPSSNPGVVRFETNRAFTGMGHEHYRVQNDVWGDRPPDELARRLFAHGGIDTVHINGNIVTVDLAKGYTSEGLQEIIESLYLYYPPVAEGEAGPDVAEAAVPEDAGEPTAEAAAADESTGEPTDAAAPADEPAADAAPADASADEAAPADGSADEAAPADEPTADPTDASAE